MTLVAPTTPLILTLRLDEESQTFFNALRRQHFPPERNYLDAHLTLFHHLPGAHLAALTQELTARSSALPPLSLQVTGLQFLGRGVAYALESSPVSELHRSLQQQWLSYLTPQDQQRRRPHITIQNKVEPAVARALYEELSATFQPFAAVGTGLHLWAYRNGPWESVQMFPFGE